jgi:hypothetical protein
MLIHLMNKFKAKFIGYKKSEYNLSALDFKEKTNHNVYWQSGP